MTPILANRIEHWPIDRLVPYARNARTHSDKQIEQIARSIQQFGFTNPILVDGAQGILGGHGRLKAARFLHLPLVPVIVLDHLSEAERRAYIIADNKLAENAGWDDDVLAAELREIQAMNFDLELTGFDDRELEKMLGVPDDDAADACPDVPEQPVTIAGDLWLLGRHRVLCGDATNAEDVARLMAGEKADMVFTDPPYGINAVKMTKAGGTVGNSGGTPFGGGGRGHTHGRTQKEIIEPKWYSPIIGDDTTETALGAYRCCAELDIPVLVFWGGNYYANELPPSRCWVVWDKENTGNFADCELAWTNLDSPARVFRHMWNGLMKASERGESRVHPTQKPVALALWTFAKFIADGKTVLDTFLGSGSTLIACEKTERVCLGMELAPAYCDVIVKRWQTYTGKQATREHDGRPFDECAADEIDIPLNSVEGQKLLGARDLIAEEAFAEGE